MLASVFIPEEGAGPSCFMNGAYTSEMFGMASGLGGWYGASSSNNLGHSSWYGANLKHIAHLTDIP